jgi:choline dehydrogenase-like flavoprotein
MTLRPFSVVHSILYDEQKGKSAVGVRVIDTNTKEEIDFYAKLIFVNAAAINTNLILLNSKSNRFPNGLGNDSGVLGKYVAFHNYSARIYAEYEGCWILRPKGGIPQVEVYSTFQKLAQTGNGLFKGLCRRFRSFAQQRV